MEGFSGASSDPAGVVDPVVRLVGDDGKTNPVDIIDFRPMAARLRKRRTGTRRTLQSDMVAVKDNVWMDLSALHEVRKSYPYGHDPIEVSMSLWRAGALEERFVLDDVRYSLFRSPNTRFIGSQRLFSDMDGDVMVAQVYVDDLGAVIAPLAAGKESWLYREWKARGDELSPLVSALDEGPRCEH